MYDIPEARTAPTDSAQQKTLHQAGQGRDADQAAGAATDRMPERADATMFHAPAPDDPIK